jgi:hypothetical protein
MGVAYLGAVYLMVDRVAELLEAARQFDRGRSPRRDAAIIRLADLRVRQARLEEAARLLEGLEHHPDAVGALAGLRLARGEAALARDLLERATGTPDGEVPTVGEFTMVGPLLALLVDVHLEEGNVDAAARVAERLDRIAGAKLAIQDFERLEASGHADAAAALLRSLGAPVRTGPKGSAR